MVRALPFVLFVTGMSGSGKTQALKSLEDIGYYCVDNIPSEIIPQLVKLSIMSQEVSRLAVGVDIRDRTFVRNFLKILKGMKSERTNYNVIFIDANDEVIMRRYKETRRKHPLDGGPIEKSIESERDMLKPIREIADYTIDTSNMNVHELKGKINQIFAEGPQEFSLFVVSFGYKYGTPQDADIVLDTRFLKNPNFDDNLKGLDGRSNKVKEYVLSDRRAGRYVKMIKDMVKFLLPEFKKEGKSYVTLAIGCTGGKHRSVVFAEVLTEYIRELGYNVAMIHRDLGKE